jgi:hypothetical protein
MIPKLNNMKDKINKVMDAYAVVLNDQDLMILSMDMIRSEWLRHASVGCIHI